MTPRMGDVRFYRLTDLVFLFLDEGSKLIRINFSVPARAEIVTFRFFAVGMAVKAECGEDK
jgi:hypothetical protein